VSQIDRAAARFELLENVRNVRTFHKPVVDRDAPELGSQLGDPDPLFVIQKRDGIGNRRQYSDAFVQSATVAKMPDQNGRRIADGTREKNGGTWNPWNLVVRYPGQEFVNRGEMVEQARRDSYRPLMPDEHDAVDNCSQKQRNVAAIENLHRIGGKEH